jgi:hypothetical protein
VIARAYVRVQLLRILLLAFLLGMRRHRGSLLLLLLVAVALLGAPLQLALGDHLAGDRVLVEILGALASWRVDGRLLVCHVCGWRVRLCRVGAMEQFMVGQLFPLTHPTIDRELWYPQSGTTLFPWTLDLDSTLVGIFQVFSYTQSNYHGSKTIENQGTVKSRSSFCYCLDVGR